MKKILIRIRFEKKYAKMEGKNELFKWIIILQNELIFSIMNSSDSKWINWLKWINITMNGKKKIVTNEWMQWIQLIHSVNYIVKYRIS